MQKFLPFFIFICFGMAQISYAQFEGEVCYVKNSYTDTAYYVYTIKDKTVRIDSYDKDKKAVRSYIINLQDNSVMMINPNRNEYVSLNLQEKNKNPEYQQNMEVIHTGNYKYINGYKCSQWRVKNYDKNTEISYWIAGNKFDFYSPMAQAIMSIEDHFLFFQSLPTDGMQGRMPLLIEKRTLLRVPKSTISLLEIKPHEVADSVFQISKYEKATLSR